MPRTADGGLLPFNMYLDIMYVWEFQCRERLMGDCYRYFVLEDLPISAQRFSAANG